MIDSTVYIENLVNKIDSSLYGEYDIQTGKTYVCDTKWARVGKTLLDHDKKFIITEIDYDNYIVAELIGEGTDVLNGYFYLDSPFFMTGTKLATNREWTIAEDNLEDKLPLIWLLEIISETGYGRGSSKERDIETRLFFLDETDPSQYYTKQHRYNVVIPMQKLMDEFLKVIDDDRMYEVVDNYRYKTFSRFGVEQEKGVFENILDANLSGVALELSLTRYKENCKC
jgi:hypothetical protein